MAPEGPGFTERVVPHRVLVLVRLGGVASSSHPASDWQSGITSGAVGTFRVQLRQRKPGSYRRRGRSRLWRQECDQYSVAR